MPSATMTSKGQLTVPKEVRESVGLHAGDRVEFRVETDGTVRLLPICLQPSEVAGMFKHRAGGKVTVEDMDKGVEEAFRRGEL